MTESATVQELKKAVIDQKKASLPLEVEDPSFEEAHQAIAAYDALVAQLVISLLQKLDLPIPEGALEQAEQAAAAALETTQARGIERYRNYKTRLDRMRALAEAARREQSSG